MSSRAAAAGAEECPICLCAAPGADWVTTECGHRFCAACLGEWVQAAGIPSCPAPECPESLTPADVAAALRGTPEAAAARARRLENDLTLRAITLLPGLVRCLGQSCGNAVLCEAAPAGAAAGEGAGPEGAAEEEGRCLERWMCECGSGAPLCTACGEEWHPRVRKCSDMPMHRRRWIEWRDKGREMAAARVPPPPPPSFQELLERVGARAAGPAADRALAAACRDAALAEAAAQEGLRVAADGSVQQRRQLISDERYKTEHCRRCPHCGRVVEKRRGCDQMLCGDDYYGNNEQRGCGLKFRWSEARPYVPRIALGPSAGEDAEAEDGPPWLAKAVWTGVQVDRKCSICGRTGWTGPALECIHCSDYAGCVYCDLSGRTAGHPAAHVFALEWGRSEEQLLRAEAEEVESLARQRAAELDNAQQHAHWQWERNVCRRMWPVLVAGCLIVLHVLSLSAPGLLAVPEYVGCTDWVARECHCGGALAAAAARPVALPLPWGAGVVGEGLAADCVPGAFYVRNLSAATQLGALRCAGAAQRYKFYAHDTAEGRAEAVRAKDGACGASACRILLPGAPDGVAEACWRTRVPSPGCWVFDSTQLVRDSPCGAGIEPGVVRCAGGVAPDAASWAEAGEAAPAALLAAAEFRGRGGRCSLLHCPDLLRLLDFLEGPGSSTAGSMRLYLYAARIIAVLALVCVLAAQAPVMAVACCHAGGRLASLRWSAEPYANEEPGEEAEGGDASSEQQDRPPAADPPDPEPPPDPAPPEAALVLQLESPPGRPRLTPPPLQSPVLPVPQLSPLPQQPDPASPGSPQPEQGGGATLRSVAVLESVSPHSCRGGACFPPSGGASPLQGHGRQTGRPLERTGSARPLSPQRQRPPQSPWSSISPPTPGRRDSSTSSSATSPQPASEHGADRTREEAARARQAAEASAQAGNCRRFWEFTMLGVIFDFCVVGLTLAMPNLPVCAGGRALSPSLVELGPVLFIPLVSALVTLCAPCAAGAVMTNMCLHRVPEEE